MEGTVILLAIGLTFYLIPAIVASHRKHRQTTAITVLNIFGGWTFIGWLAALVWACTN